MKLAIVGATGLVGTTMLKILQEINFPIESLFLVASDRSVGKTLTFENRTYKVISILEAIKLKPDIALFSAGGGISKQYAPLFAKVGTTVVDNSSAWRMDSSKKLIVPEINAHKLTKDDKIIANPNCSTIQMVLALYPLHKKYAIRRIVVSTYQSVTGSGVKAIKQLFGERKEEQVEKAYPHKIDLNILPHIDEFLDNGYTKEEMKMIEETQKILDDTSIHITSTTVRIPVIGGHSESVNIEFHEEFNLEDIRNLLEKQSGVIVQDNLKENLYPMPLYAHEKDEVFVGRIRRDFSQPKTLNLWVVSDNLRKGAATNTIQIAEYLVKNKLLKNL